MPMLPEMPTLLEVQQAMRRSLSCAVADRSPVPGLGAPALERLAVYRNTCRSTLVNALRLSFPAVRQLVGEEFFDGAAQYFIDDAEAGIPGCVWLHEYGSEFAAFLASFRPAAGLPYLSDVARLEWAVNGALHAPDAARLDIARLASLIGGRADARLVPHPSIALLSLRYPADAIWRAVLDDDDAALSAVDLASGPVWLLIERAETGVQVQRLAASDWRLMDRLCTGQPLHAALEANPDVASGDEASPDEAAVLLAAHLSAGRFVDVLLPREGASSSPQSLEACRAPLGTNHLSGDRAP